MGTGAQWTGGEWLVVEADESDGTHLELPLFGTILTNVEIDHLDFYGTEEAIIASFDHYLVAASPGPKVLCIDDPVCAELAARHGAITYGTSAAADYRAVDVQADDGSYTFTVARAGATLGTRRPCRCAASTTCATRSGRWRWLLAVGVDVRRCRTRPGQVRRRRPSVRHPRRRWWRDPGRRLRPPAERDQRRARRRRDRSGDGWRRVVAVFQPNRFNRMAVMSPAYRDAFVDADLVVLTDIFASGTTPIPGVTGKLVVNAVLDAHPATRLAWMPRRPT